VKVKGQGKERDDHERIEEVRVKEQGKEWDDHEGMEGCSRQEEMARLMEVEGDHM